MTDAAFSRPNDTPLYRLRLAIEDRYRGHEHRATDLELREYQKLMKRVNAADPFLKRV